MNNFNYINGKMVKDILQDPDEEILKRDKSKMKDVVIKEDFCGACLALPLAFAGAGTATATSGDTSENKSKSSIFFWSVVISIIGLIATVWFLSGDCTTCVSEGNSRGRRTGSMVCSSKQR
ncbi:010R [Invertebrate iridescent virus Kaz2018]|nr:010R [Invertebrate iridescent virus Kaz2018]